MTLEEAHNMYCRGKTVRVYNSVLRSFTEHILLGSLLELNGKICIFSRNIHTEYESFVPIELIALTEIDQIFIALKQGDSSNDRNRS